MQGKLVPRMDLAFDNKGMNVVEREQLERKEVTGGEGGEEFDARGGWKSREQKGRGVFFFSFFWDELHSSLSLCAEFLFFIWSVSICALLGYGGKLKRPRNAQIR